MYNRCMPYLLKTVPEPEPLDCKILTAALELFVDHGFHNVSVHDIQKQAGVSIGSIYKHFGGKQGIAQALYDHLMIELDELIDRVVLEHSDIRAQCTALVELLFTFTESHRYIIAYLFDSKHSEYLESAKPLSHSVPFNRVYSMLKSAISSGEITCTDASIVSSLIFGSAIRMINLRLDGVIQTPLEGRHQELMRMAWKGIESA